MKNAISKRFACCVMALLWGGETLAEVRGAGSVFNSRRLERVIQFLIDPTDANTGWMLTKTKLQVNQQLRATGRWHVVFDPQTFREVTGISRFDQYRHRQISVSRGRSGTLFLEVEVGLGGKSKVFQFLTRDYGANWSDPSRTAVVDRSPPARTNRRARRRPRPKRRGKPPSVEGEAVDLNNLEEDEAPKEAQGGRYGGRQTGSQPLFKMLFDLLLQVRPGANPLTFDNFHTLLLVDVLPKPEVRFSFEVSPAPRYYELAYRPFDGIEFKGGRIWIPFGQTRPHSLFGGFVNTSALRQPGSDAFLPDLWTDLGVGLRAQLIDQQEFGVEAQLYVVNGFQSGATDPAGETGQIYPNFENTPNIDNNQDKAMGGRLYFTVGTRFGLGGSLYSGRYTNEDSVPRRLTAAGLDSQFSLTPMTRLRAGYLYMDIGLSPDASVPSSVRGGFYGELEQDFGRQWKIILRGGASQHDSRAILTTDQTVIGGALVYSVGPFLFSVQHFRDVQDVDGKVVKEFSALRALVRF